MFFNLLAAGDATGEVAGEAAGEAVAETTKTVDWTAVWHTVRDWLTTTGIRVVIAILVLLISFLIINLVTKRIYKSLHKRNADETLARIGTKSARVVLKILVAVCLIGYVGIEMASISAVIASVGVGISLAVQGTLSNFAGGVIIIVMRPFRIGDKITSNGQTGVVEDIKLFYTHIVTADNRAVVIPNGALANNVIVNDNAKDTRRVDLLIQVAYGSDVPTVKKIIMQVCESNELVFKDPAPFVELSNLGESSLDFTVRTWCNSPDYWTVNFALIESIKSALEENGIEIPFNQLDVNVKSLPEKTEKK